MTNTEKMDNTEKRALLQKLRGAMQAHKEAHSELIDAHQEALAEQVRLGDLRETDPHYRHIVNLIAAAQAKYKVFEDDTRDRIAKIEAQLDNP